MDCVGEEKSYSLIEFKGVVSCFGHDKRDVIMKVILGPIFLYSSTPTKGWSSTLTHLYSRTRHERECSVVEY